MDSKPVIRPYQPADKNAIRELCCDTGHAGKPIDGVFPDREIFADFWTGYYTDHEPDAIWIAEIDGRVAGYVTGCFDENQRQRVMSTQILPRLLGKMFLKGLFWESRVWSLIGSAMFPKKPEKMETYFPRDPRCAHLHINIAPGAQGKGVGTLLIHQLEEQARSKGITMLLAETREDNVPANRFFERLGFHVQELRKGFRVRGQTFNVVLFAKK